MVNRFNMITPDGQPVRWALNLLHNTQLRDRVYGPVLMLRLCRQAAADGIPVYLYGSSPEVVEALQCRLRQKCPGLKVAGYESPPFRKLTAEEDQQVVERLSSSGAGLVFVGLGCPKQDVFAAEHRDRIRAVLICVGAAFDFLAGMKKTAPAWMQRNGLEWLFRLSQEPTRLWKRYLTSNCLFLWMLARAWLSPPRDARRGQAPPAVLRPFHALAAIAKGIIRRIFRRPNTGASS
jgi:exopolysaccharide biosynthesis WecB/TagA/CpsF family protein